MGASADYRAFARRVRSLPDEIVRAGAKEMQLSIMGRLRADTGGDMALSGISRRKKTKLATTLTVTPGRALSTASVKASPKKMLGPWSWLEHGTGPRHMRKRHMRLDMLASGDDAGWRTGPWTAAGSPAKHTFSEAVKRGTPGAQRAMEDEWERAHRG